MIAALKSDNRLMTFINRKLISATSWVSTVFATAVTHNANACNCTLFTLPKKMEYQVRRVAFLGGSFWGELFFSARGANRSAKGAIL